MKPFQTILIGADFSEGSREAFRAACSLAIASKTRMHVVHVIEPHWIPEEPVPFGQAVVGFYDAKADGGRDEMLKRRLRDMYAPAEPIDVEYHLREGEAAAGILRMAGQLQPDLIVVGTHGRTGLSWLLAGSVATSVFRRAPCPVLALHLPEHRRKFEGIRTILHPTDFSLGCKHSLLIARSLARDLGARLVLLHVVPYGFYANDMTVPVDPTIYQQALLEERHLVDGPDLKYPVETRLARGDAAEEILRAAAERDCGLIVMGTHGRTGLGRLLMGSITEYVLPRAECPVLAVKTPRRAETRAAEQTPQPVAAAR
jgi:nucleotide-binding universal stress UspA family protein